MRPGVCMCVCVGKLISNERERKISKERDLGRRYEKGDNAREIE